MAKRKVSWTKTAKLDFTAILLYYIERNKSKTYSSRLFKEVKLKLKTLDFTVALPQKTAIKDLFYFTHNHICVFFVIYKNSITVKFIIDERRNPSKIITLLNILD